MISNVHIPGHSVESLLTFRKNITQCQREQIHQSMLFMYISEKEGFVLVGKIIPQIAFLRSVLLLFTVIRLKILWQHDEKTGEQKYPVFPSVVMYSSFKGHLLCSFLQDVI